MLDINLIREQTDFVRQALLKRLPAGANGGEFDLDGILKLDDQRRVLIARADEARAERNQCSKTKPDAAMIKKMRTLGTDIAALEEDLRALEFELKNKIAELPNLPAEDVVAGGKENNQVLRELGKMPAFEFPIKDHVALATDLGLIDYERAAKMSGAGFWIYTGAGAQLEWALLNYFMDFHRGNGYTFIWAPYLLNEASAYASGHLPKFRDDLYWVEDGLCLNATSEMMLNNFHRDEILDEKSLPRKYYAYSACFRREAGSYRKEERGMVRGHQFNKVEMFQFVRPEYADGAFEELVKNAQALVEGLGLYARVSQLAAGDCSAAMRKTCDIEVWIPSMETYREVSSVSNAGEYQARRSNIRFKNIETGKNEFVHTLNGSGLATSRIIPALLEQGQQADGSVILPKALQKYLGFDRLEAIKK